MKDGSVGLVAGGGAEEGISRAVADERGTLELDGKVVVENFWEFGTEYHGL